MNRIRIGLVVFACLFMTVVSACATVTQRSQIPPLRERNIRIRYQLPKSDYVVAEPILLRSWVENTGTHTEYFAQEETWRFRVVTLSGDSVRRAMDWPYPQYLGTEFVPEKGDGQFHALKAKATTRTYVDNVLDHFGKGDGMFDFYLPPGTYMIFSAEVRSDTVSFTVREPELPADQLIAQRLLAMMDSKTMWMDRDSVRQIYSELAEIGRGSVYEPRLLFRLLHLNRENPPVKNAYALRLITEYASSTFAGQALRELQPNLLSAQQKEQLLRALPAVRAHTLSPSRSAEIDSLEREIRK
jgi:hypothetical protein